MSDEINAGTGPNIVLRDHDDTPVEHEFPANLQVDTADGGTTKYVHESLVAEPVEKTVELDFSGGDMTVTPEEGQAFSRVSIPMPANLIPANIAEGVNIAGIIGTMAAGSGGGGSSDWNIFVKIATAPSAGSVWEIATAEEIEKCGITLYSGAGTLEHLKTVMLMTKLRTGVMTEETKTTVNIEYAQNWQLSCTGSANNTDNGVLQYQTGTKTATIQRVAANTNNAWGVNQTMALSLNNLGLRHTGIAYLSATRCPIGTYLFVILQHKTARVCDEMA